MYGEIFTVQRQNRECVTVQGQSRKSWSVLSRIGECGIYGATGFAPDHNLGGGHSPLAVVWY